MIDDLREFVERPAVRAIVIATLVAYPSVAFLRVCIQDFVVNPLTLPRYDSGLGGLFDNFPGHVTIAGRDVNWADPVRYAVAVVLALLVVAFLRRGAGAPRAAARCPHCASLVPRTAAVCWACTRELT